MAPLKFVCSLACVVAVVSPGTAAPTTRSWPSPHPSPGTDGHSHGKASLATARKPLSGSNPSPDTALNSVSNSPPTSSAGPSADPAAVGVPGPQQDSRFLFPRGEVNPMPQLVGAGEKGIRNPYLTASLGSNKAILPLANIVEDVPFRGDVIQRRRGQSTPKLQPAPVGQNGEPTGTPFVVKALEVPVGTGIVVSGGAPPVGVPTTNLRPPNNNPQGRPIGNPSGQPGRPIGNPSSQPGRPIGNPSGQPGRPIGNPSGQPGGPPVNPAPQPSPPTIFHSPTFPNSPFPTTTTPGVLFPGPTTPSRPTTPNIAFGIPTTVGPFVPRPTTPFPFDPRLTPANPSLPRPTTQNPFDLRPTTPRPFVPNPTTLRPFVPNPTTPRPFVPNPTTPRPFVPDPTTPRPFIPNQTTPRPFTPGPTTQRPVAPRPTTFRPVAPRPTTFRPVVPRPPTFRPVAPRPTTFRPVAPRPTTFRPIAPGPVTPRPTGPSPPSQRPSTTGIIFPVVTTTQSSVPPPGTTRPLPVFPRPAPAPHQPHNPTGFHPGVFRPAVNRVPSFGRPYPNPRPFVPTFNGYPVIPSGFPHSHSVPGYPYPNTRVFHFVRYPVYVRNQSPGQNYPSVTNFQLAFPSPGATDGGTLPAVRRPPQVTLQPPIYEFEQEPRHHRALQSHSGVPYTVDDARGFTTDGNYLPPRQG